MLTHGTVLACITLSKVLAKYRLSPPSAVYGGFDLQGTKFGVYLTPLNSGTVRMTDQVHVLRFISDTTDTQ